MADDSPPSPAKQLSAASTQRLNELLRSGVPFRQAYAQLRAEAGAMETAQPLSLPKAPLKLEGRAPAQTREDVHAHLDALAARLAKSGIVPAEERVGCTPQEVATLREHAHIPYAYEAFLQRFGKQRCRLYSHDHLAIEFPHLEKMQRTARKNAEAWGGNIPPEAFVVCGSLAAAYAFVVVGPEVVDAPVWFTNEETMLDARPYFASVLGWIDALASDAERAWASGYFRDRPRGTTA